MSSDDTLLLRTLEGPLDGEEEDRLAARLRGEPALARRLLELALLESLTHEAVRSASPRRRSSTRVHLWGISTMAASLLVLTLVVARIVSTPSERPLEPGQAKESPEKLFKGMEDRLSKAATVRIEGTTGKEGEAPWKGKVAVGEARLDADVTGATGGVPTRVIIVTNGPMLQVTWMNFTKKTTHTEIKRVPPNLRAWATGKLARSGLSGLVDTFSAERPLEEILASIAEDKAPALSAFKAGGKEKVGDREATVVEYDLGPKGSASKVRLWLDPATGLPLRRTVTARAGGKDHAATDTYDTFEVTAP